MQREMLNVGGAPWEWEGAWSGLRTPAVGPANQADLNNTHMVHLMPLALYESQARRMALVTGSDHFSAHEWRINRILMQ